MRQLRDVPWLSLLGLVLIGTAFAQQNADSINVEGPVEVTKIAVCENVEDRTPLGESEEFVSDIGALYCFTTVEGAAEPTQIFHRWYVEDRLINEIEIMVKGPRWRCWSRKTILPRWKGDCRVEIMNEAGDVLAEQNFTLN